MTLTMLLSFAAFFLSLIGTRILLLALRQRTPAPDLRMLREGSAPLPRAGAALTLTLIVCLQPAGIGYAMTLSLLLLLTLFMLDDLLAIPALVRLIVLLMAMTPPLAMLPAPLFNGMLPSWLDLTLQGGLWLGFVYLYRGLNDVEGLPAAYSTALALGIAVAATFAGTFPDPLSTHGLILAAAACGAWWWTKSPAKALLGDAGAVPAAFLLGYLLLQMAHAGHGVAALILPAYCAADGICSQLRRLRLGLSRSRYYCARALERGRRSGHIVRTVFGITALLTLLASQSVVSPSLFFYQISMAYLCVCLLLGFFAHERSL